MCGNSSKNAKLRVIGMHERVYDIVMSYIVISLVTMFCSLVT